MVLQHWLSHWLGMDGSATSLAWGGFLSCLGYFAIVGTLLRKHNCEVKPCWRLSKHTTNGGHVVCRKHMPGGSPSAQQVVDAHNAATPLQAPRIVYTSDSASVADEASVQVTASDDVNGG